MHSHLPVLSHFHYMYLKLTHVMSPIYSCLSSSLFSPTHKPASVILVLSHIIFRIVSSSSLSSFFVLYHRPSSYLSSSRPNFYCIPSFSHCSTIQINTGLVI